MNCCALDPLKLENGYTDLANFGDEMFVPELPGTVKAVRKYGKFLRSIPIKNDHLIFPYKLFLPVKHCQLIDVGDIKFAESASHDG